MPVRHFLGWVLNARRHSQLLELSKDEQQVLRFALHQNVRIVNAESANHLDAGLDLSSPVHSRGTHHRQSQESYLPVTAQESESLIRKGIVRAVPLGKEIVPEFHLFEGHLELLPQWREHVAQMDRPLSFRSRLINFLFGWLVGH